MWFPEGLILCPDFFFGRITVCFSTCCVFVQIIDTDIPPCNVLVFFLPILMNPDYATKHYRQFKASK
jgi:hypothetical protein